MNISLETFTGAIEDLKAMYGGKKMEGATTEETSRKLKLYYNTTLDPHTLEVDLWAGIRLLLREHEGYFPAAATIRKYIERATSQRAERTPENRQVEHKPKGELATAESVVRGIPGISDEDADLVRGYWDSEPMSRDYVAIGHIVNEYPRF